MASHDKGNTWKVIKEELKKLNYNVYDDPLILNTLYFGVPQSRERVVILCKRKDLGELPELPEISKKNIKKTSLKSIIIKDKKIPKKYFIKGKMKATQEIWNNFLNILNENDIKVPKFPIWTDWWDSDGENTSVTKIDKKLSDEENEILIKKEKKIFIKNILIGLIKIENFIKITKIF